MFAIWSARSLRKRAVGAVHDPVVHCERKADAHFDAWLSLGVHRRPRHYGVHAQAEVDLRPAADDAVNDVGIEPGISGEDTGGRAEQGGVRRERWSSG